VSVTNCVVCKKPRILWRAPMSFPPDSQLCPTCRMKAGLPLGHDRSTKKSEESK